MQTENNAQKKTGRKISVKNVVLWALLLLVLILLILFFAVPAYLSSDSGKNLILGKVNSVIDGKVKVDAFSMGWFDGVKVQKFDFTNDTGCTKITAKQIAARPSYFSLLAGKLAINKAVIDQPTVLIDTTGPCSQKKVQQPQSQPSQSQLQSSPAAAALAVERINLTINEGNFKFIAADANDVSQILELRDINSKLAIKPLGSKSDFDISMTVASANEVSQIKASGDIKTAKKGWSFADTTGQITLEVNDLDLSSLDSLFAALDVNAAAKGRINASLDAKLEKGLFENLQGKVKASRLDIAGDFLKGDRIQSSSLDADVKLSSTERVVNIDKLKIKADGLDADIRGTIPKTVRSLEDFLKADSPDTLQAQFDCDVAKTFKQVKTIAGFKEDFDINYGRLSGNINTEAQNGKRMLTGKIKLWALEGKFPVKRIMLSKPVEVDAKIISQKDKITVEKLAVDSSFVKANLNGTTDNMNYTARLDLAKMQSDVGQFIEIKPLLIGDVNLTGRGSFVKGVLSSVGSGALSNVLVKMPDGAEISEPAANIKYDFTSDFEKKHIYVKSADITASPGRLNLKDSRIPLGSDAVSQVQINADMAVELAKALPYLRTFGKLDPKMQLAGFAQGDIALSIKDNIVDAIAKQISLKNFNLAYPDRQPFSQEYMNIAFSGRFDTAAKIYTIEKLQLVSPQIKLSGKLSNAEIGQNMKTEGSLRADYDLAAASSLISPFLPSGFSATGNRSDSISFVSTYPKQDSALFTSNLSTKTSFGFDTAEYMGLNIGKSEFNVNIDKGLMTIAPFSSTVNKGMLSFAASADFKEKPPILRTPGPVKILDKIQITRQTTDALLRYVNPLFADASDISGVLSFDSEKIAFPLQTGYKNAIEVTGTLTIDDMRLGGSSLLGQIVQLAGVSPDAKIAVLPCRFVLADGILRYDDMQMNIDDKSINFSGQIGLDKSMQMTVTLPWTRSGQRIRLPLKGTVDRPEIDMSKLLEQQLQQELENQIKQGLEKIFK
ncbi:MAG: hypothetical protein PHQ00_01860 [Phycisphaerae bacterium]|nr:hypothetical protein [Phycisphaerae bacterium]